MVENEDDGIDFPYAFLNKDELFPSPESVDLPMKEALTNFLLVDQTKEDNGVDHPRLKDVFSAHYVELLEAIA